MLDSPMNDCGGGEGVLFDEVTHFVHSHVDNEDGGEVGGYGAEGGVVELESEEEVCEGDTPFTPNTHTHLRVETEAIGVGHEHLDDDMRHGGGPQEHETHRGGGVAAEAVLHQSAGGEGAMDDGAGGDRLTDGDGRCSGWRWRRCGRHAR